MPKPREIVKVDIHGKELARYPTAKEAAQAFHASANYIRTRCHHRIRRGIYQKDPDGNWCTFRYADDEP